MSRSEALATYYHDLEVLDVGAQTDYTGTRFPSPEPKSRQKNNFASTISSGVKSLSRLARFSTESCSLRRQRKRRNRKRDYSFNGKYHFPVYTASMPGFFLSTDIAGNGREIYWLRAKMFDTWTPK